MAGDIGRSLILKKIINISTCDIWKHAVACCIVLKGGEPKDPQKKRNKKKREKTCEMEINALSSVLKQEPKTKL